MNVSVFFLFMMKCFCNCFLLLLFCFEACFPGIALAVLDQSSLELSDLPSSASSALGSEVGTTTTVW